MNANSQVSRPTVTVIIVSYNTRELVRRCLLTLTDVHQVIVVDNNSQDESADLVEKEFPSVVLIRNKSNRGFGAANNQGLHMATGELVLLLNSDAHPEPGAISALADCLKEDIVAAGGKLTFPNGKLQESSASQLTLWRVFCEQTFLERIFKSSPLFSGYWNSHRLPDGGPVDQVMGACLMMKRIDGQFLRFDERIFLYCEDTELCTRLRANGQIYYCPSAVFVHDLGASSSSTRWQSVAYYNRGKELYFEIHQGRVSSLLCLVLNRFGAILRILAGGLVTPKARLFWRVLFINSRNLEGYRSMKGTNKG